MMGNIFSQCIGKKDRSSTPTRARKEIHSHASSSSTKIRFLLNDKPIKRSSPRTLKPDEIQEIPSHLTPATKPRDTLKNITALLKTINKNKRPPISTMINLMLKNECSIRKVTEALLILDHADIAISNELIRILTANGNDADEIAIAFIYLHKCDIPLTGANIEEIANAGPRVWEVATAVAWFASNIDSRIHTINALISALTEEQGANVAESIHILAGYLIPTTDVAIEAIARIKSSMGFRQAVLTLQKEGIKLTSKDISALAQVQDESIHEVAEKIRSSKEKAKWIIQDLIRHSLLPPPAVADKIPLAPAITATEMKVRL